MLNILVDRIFFNLDLENIGFMGGGSDYIDYVNANAGQAYEDYIVPAVVHVMYDDNDIILSESEIEQAISNLNYYLQNITDSHIQVDLAGIDPDGNCTNGIVYVPVENSNVVPTLDETSPFPCAIADVQLKDLNRWDVYHYLNIWIVGGIFDPDGTGCDGPVTIGGYSIPMGLDYPEHDGIVMFSEVLLADFPDPTHLVHEFGHYLSLYHPWGPGGQPARAVVMPLRIVCYWGTGYVTQTRAHW